MFERFIPAFILVWMAVSSFSVGREETFTSSTVLAEATQSVLEIDTLAIRADPLEEIARNYILSNDMKEAERTIQQIGELYSSQPPTVWVQYGPDVRSRQLGMVDLLARLAAEAMRVGLEPMGG